MKKLTLLNCVITARTVKNVKDFTFEFRKGFWTFNKGIKYWDVRDPKFNERKKEFEIIPIRNPTFRI